MPVKVSAAMARKLGVTPAVRRRVTKAVAKVQPYPIDAMCRDAGLPEPIPEYKFAADRGRKFAFDWAWPESYAVDAPGKLALEIDGGLFGRGKKCQACGRRRVGAHSSIRQLLLDREKTNLAACMGWRVLRVQPKDVRSGKVLELIREALGIVAAGRVTFAIKTSSGKDPSPADPAIFVFGEKTIKVQGKVQGKYP